MAAKLLSTYCSPNINIQLRFLPMRNGQCLCFQVCVPLFKRLGLLKGTKGDMFGSAPRRTKPTSEFVGLLWPSLGPFLFLAVEKGIDAQVRNQKPEVGGVLVCSFSQVGLESGWSLAQAYIRNLYLIWPCVPETWRFVSPLIFHSNQPLGTLAEHYLYPALP